MSALDFTYFFVKFNAICRKVVPFARFDGSKGLVVRRLPRTARGKYVSSFWALACGLPRSTVRNPSTRGLGQPKRGMKKETAARQERLQNSARDEAIRVSFLFWAFMRMPEGSKARCLKIVRYCCNQQLVHRVPRSWLLPECHQ